MRIKTQTEWLNEKIFVRKNDRDYDEVRRKEYLNKLVQIGKIKDYIVQLEYNKYRKYMKNEILLDKESKGDD